MFCGNCGAYLEDGAKFCSECGNPIEETPSEELEEVEEKQGKGKGKGVILLFAGVLLAIVVGLLGGNALFKYLNSDNGDDGSYISDDEDKEVTEDQNKEQDKDTEKTEDTEAVSEDVKKQDDAEDEKEVQEDIQEEIPEDEPPVIPEKPQVSVEDEVLRIREEYNDITKKVSNGTYTEAILSEGVQGYYNGSELKEIVIYKGVEGSEYSRYFYFNEGQLMFAYYEGSDAHRFYFYEGALMRWRYSKSTANSQDAVNYDWESSSQFYEWEDLVKRDAKKYY